MRRNLFLVVLIMFAMTFVSCGAEPGSLVVEMKTPENSSSEMFMSMAEATTTGVIYFQADSGKIILENSENRIEVDVDPTLRSKEVDDIPPGTYSLTLVFYDGDVMTAWGYVPEVTIERNVKKYIAVALKIQKEWK